MMFLSAIFQVAMYGCLLTVIAFLMLIIVIPFALAVAATIRDLIREGAHMEDQQFRTALYSGRVSHVRHGIDGGPSHSFSYPIFWFLIDLKEADKVFKDYLWPFSNSYVLKFDASGDHLINGEGVDVGSDVGIAEDVDNTANLDDLDSRIRNIVRERTNGKCDPKGDILLQTNLTYFGYCFNPVSFYYVLKENTPKKLLKMKQCWEIEAIVAEVSNTPWLEMHCYVLHPQSSDITEVKAGRKSAQWTSINYIFKKTFHVSPFFEMDFDYDWTIWKPGRKIAGSTTLKKKGKTAFNALFEAERVQSLCSFHLFYFMMKFPMYCVLIQVWIHVQAFFLTTKGVEFIPHPEDSETIFSQIIAAGMAPYYAIKERIDNERQNNLEKRKLD